MRRPVGAGLSAHVVNPPQAVETSWGHGAAVQCGSELPAAAESESGGLARTGRDQGDAGVPGEVGFGAAAGGMGRFADQLGGGLRAAAGQRQQLGACARTRPLNSFPSAPYLTSVVSCGAVDGWPWR